MSITTGTELLRVAVNARNKSTNLSWMAKELGISNETLHDFACGSSDLAADKLQALTAILFAGHAVFDEKIDRLRSARQSEPTTYIHPPSVKEMNLPKFTVPASRIGPQPLVKTPQPKPGPRPGWAD